MSITQLNCTVYKSLKKNDTYVFIPFDNLLTDLPEELSKILGQTEMVMSLNLTPGKKMARGTATEILKNIKNQGFHLQMPDNSQLNVNPLPSINERFLDKNI